MEHQYHFGRKFYIDNERGYWTSTDYPRVSAHIWVWVNVNGEIPKGFHVHHIDENKSNNDIENLMIISASDHARLHMTEERRALAREWAQIIRPLTKEWHASDEGRKWHREHAARCGFGKNEPVEYVCQKCNVIYKSSKLSNVRFCSNKCKSAWRRDSGVDDIEIRCEKCNSLFRSNKYDRRKYCSRKCSPGRPKSQEREEA